MENLIPEEFYYIESPIFVNEDWKSIKIVRNLIGFINFGGDIGLCRVEVNNGESMAPHFHVTDHKDFDIGICIYHPYWYVHIGELYGRNDITPEFGEILNNWLDKKSEQDINLTNWELICKIWWNVADYENLYEDFDFNHCKDLEMPNYTKLIIFPDFEPGDDTWYMEERVIGKINLPDGIGECDVISFNLEIGMIPHFHIVSKDRASFNLCICICSSEYFFHDESSKTEISEEIKNTIDRWLREESDRWKTSNWHVTVRDWYWVYDSIFVKVKKKLRTLVPNVKSQPDYTKMKELDSKEKIVYEDRRLSHSRFGRSRQRISKRR